MKNKLQELIASKELTPKEKVVADYVMDNLQHCCFITSTELANTLNLSYSSVIRLTRTLGFSGYSEFQDYLRSIYAGQSDNINESIMIPAERIDEILKQDRIASVQDNVCAHVLRNIQTTLENNPPELYEKACKLLLESNVKYILSSRGSNCIAEFLNVIMRQIIPHVYNYGNKGQNIFDFTSDLGPGDCAIVISYPRYSKLTMLAAEMAHKQGAKIILITDKPTSPLTKYADIVFTANGSNNEFYNTYVPGLFAAEMLCATLCRVTNYSNSDLLKRIDEYTSQIGNY